MKKSGAPKTLHLMLDEKWNELLDGGADSMDANAALVNAIVRARAPRGAQTK